MDKPQPKLFFHLMALGFKIRDMIKPRRPIVQEAGLQKGFHVLDYGCGPGSYIFPSAEIIGPTGKLYAADIHPLALEYARKIAAKKKLPNTETILTDCRTGLEEQRIDVILFFDVLHGLQRAGPIIEEFHRILKPTGLLTVSDHHLKADQIISRITASGLFSLSKQGQYVLIFARTTPA